MKYEPKNISIDWLNTIWDTDLPYQSKYLACYLRKFMNSQNDMAWPSYSRMVHETGLSKSTIARYLSILDDEGWLSRSRGNLGKNTTYTVSFPTSVTQRLVSHRDLTSVTQTPTSVRETHELNKELNKELNNNKTLDQIHFDRLFELFWKSGIRKVNKKKAKSLFTNILKKNKDRGWSEFTEILVEDIQERIRINQLGFSQMHPTTYLNGERWKDEKVIENEKTQRSTQPRSSAVSRVREAGQRREAEIKARISELETMGSANGDIRSSDRTSVRCSNAGELETTIEGDYTRSDC